MKTSHHMLLNEVKIIFQTVSSAEKFNIFTCYSLANPILINIAFAVYGL